MFHERNVDAVGMNSKVIYEQVALCWADPSVNASVPLLKEAANVALAILYTIKAVKGNKIAYHRLAYHAADLIVVIWRSYNKTKVPEHWFSPQMEDILQELLENLNSIYEFIDEKVSMNTVLRLIFSRKDMDKIRRYHELLKIAIDKFEVLSHIGVCQLMAQILKKQERLSDQIQHRNDAKTIVSKSSAAAAHDHQIKPKRRTYSIDVQREGATARVSFEVATAFQMERTARSEEAVENSENVEGFPTTNAWTESRSNPILSSTSTSNRPWTTHENHAVNQGIRNGAHANTSDQSQSYYYYQ